MNIVALTGNLTRAPEVRYTPQGQAVADLRLAVNKQYTTKAGEKREEVLFIDVTVWGPQAENAAKYLAKGSKVNVTGSLQGRPWEGKTGEKHYEIKVGGAFVEYLDFKKDAGAKPEVGAEPQGEDEVPF